jgi:hypothetical protein
MNSKVLRYFDLGTSFDPATRIARSLVIKPYSTVSMITLSRVSLNNFKALLLSNFDLANNPYVHAKIEAIEFVEVSCPF